VVVELAREFTCPGCGERSELSAKNMREHRRRGTVPICRDCRLPPARPDPEEAERLRRWWLARYSVDELREIGELIGWR
jgi:hypothetical protein